MEAILKRRSIRKYTDKPVSDSLVTGLLEAAMAAPSAGNQQPWHFVVLRNRELIDKIPSFHPYSGMVKGASVVVLVCGDIRNLKYGKFWVQDCSAATENMLLAVQEKGLGAVWLGVYPLAERVNGFTDLLGLPENIIPFAAVPIGYPAEEKAPSSRFDEARVHYDQW